MWELIKDERYVADPKKGSGHNRGIAVDLTIIDRTTGKELDMGTGFDNFYRYCPPKFQKFIAGNFRQQGIIKNSNGKKWFRRAGNGMVAFFWNNPDFELLDIDPKKFKKL